MQVADRVSLKTFHMRVPAISYDSGIVRFGASDGVQLESIHYTIEGLSYITAFYGIALSRNPEHEEGPPDEIAEFFTDESLYGRCAWGTLQGASPVTTWADFESLSKVIPMHGIVVPSRQQFIHMLILGGSSTWGVVAEVYYREVKLSRAEADLLNITWGKYRR